jgi:hypothetical protein
MNRTLIETYYPSVNLEDIDNVERHMSKEELIEMKNKLDSLTSNLYGIPDVSTRALMEKMLRYGYFSAHLKLGNNKS